MLTEIYGYIAAFLTSASFIPQAIKVIKTKDTSSISLIMYSMFSLGIFFWIIYGIVKISWPMIIANITTFVFALIILIMKIKHK